MSKKSFFREREANEIQDLNVKSIYTSKGLIDRIENLDLTREALEIRTPIIPGRFFQRIKTGAQASRKDYHHGDLIPLSHPTSQSDCNSCSEIPLAIRARDFDELRKMKEEEIYFVGYSFQPSWGDRKKRVVPFVFLPQAVRLFGYAESQTQGIKVEPHGTKKFDHDYARRVASEGASTVLEVPSKSRKQPRYKFKLLHVPIIRNEENLATILTLKKALMIDPKTNEPIKGTTPFEDYDIRYTWENEREGSERIVFYPHDIAAYIAIIKYYKEKHNLTPIDMNPFALPSKHQAEFYKKLSNNLLFYDPTLTSKSKLRKPHLAEKSILLARALAKFGNDDFSFWDPERDGKLKDYYWSIPKL